MSALWIINLMLALNYRYLDRKRTLFNILMALASEISLYYQDSDPIRHYAMMLHNGQRERSFVQY